MHLSCGYLFFLVFKSKLIIASIYNQAIGNPFLKRYRTNGVNYLQPLSASYSKQEKLTPLVLYNICISFIYDRLYFNADIVLVLPIFSTSIDVKDLFYLFFILL